jgi:2-polyprenyl-6-methoxyphenol hydroxylase-like FAD-dependent oxidoreductase
VSGLRVAVAGGGLGGLCLAQGLLKAGVDVTVYERDAQLAGRRQGYRLHVAASQAAEAETGTRHNRLMFWLYRRMTGARA